MFSNIFDAYREAKVVDFHLAEVAVLLELILGVQVVVAVRAHAVDLVAVKYAICKICKYAKYANMQYVKYANVHCAIRKICNYGIYAKYANMQYVNYVNMQYAKYARRSGSCRWDGNMFSALFAMKTIVGEANTSIR